jgi:Flp pilus assembly protein TadB
MATFEATAAPAVASLQERQDAELYQELALRVKGVYHNPASAGDVDAVVEYDAALMGPLDDLQEWGRRFFNRFIPDAYNLVCGASDAGEREKVQQAFSIGPEAVGGAIAGVIVAQFGLAPAAAAVVAALIMRLFFRNAYNAMCEVWKEKLPQQG